MGAIESGSCTRNHDVGLINTSIHRGVNRRQ